MENMICENKTCKIEIEKYNLNFDLDKLPELNCIGIENKNDALINLLSEHEKKRILLNKIMENFATNNQIDKLIDNSNDTINDVINDTINDNTINNIKTKCIAILDIFKANQLTKMIEDDNWIFHDKTSIKYKIKSNKILFENTISTVNSNSIEVTNYLENLIKILQKANINAEYQLCDDTKSMITFILVICKK